MSRYSDIDPRDIDPATNRPYAGYSSPSLDTSFHDGEMDVDDRDIVRTTCTRGKPLTLDLTDVEFPNDDARRFYISLVCSNPEGHTEHIVGGRLYDEMAARAATEESRFNADVATRGFEAVIRDDIDEFDSLGLAEFDREQDHTL